ncbi:MAG: exodeoxyribonuclease VII large subunit [Deltaproteobacteria bacterium]|nr:exodeoxyribonuclease VII large subunit [Deltaproteobacteria bacterium]
MSQTPEHTGPRVYTVTELTKAIQDLLEKTFDFVWIEGEISNFRAPVSGHYYMAIKDEASQIRAVMFRLQARYLKFVPEDGMRVVAQGRIGVYAPRGEYQIILDYLEPLGVGALALAFEQVKKKLAAQGIFDEDIKKPLPFLPKKIAVITSPTGAAIRDFIHVIQRRFANLTVIVVPVRVQGEEACNDMIKALELVNRKVDADVVVLTRGGGSLEDLWGYNQEALALAIRNSRIPVVSAVGHEIDLTISDLAADLRAPTPSAAAEILVAEKEALLHRVKDLRQRIVSMVEKRVQMENHQLNSLARRIRDPRKQLTDLWMRLDETHQRLIRVMKLNIKNRHHTLRGEIRTLRLHAPSARVSSIRQKLDYHEDTLRRSMEARLKELKQDWRFLQKRLTDLSPLAILKRGYSITRTLPEKRVLKDASGVEKGDRVQVLLGEGALGCRIETIEH